MKHNFIFCVRLYKNFLIATPDRRQASLPSSPVTVDTPNRTSELLTSTSDISPIASTQSSSDEEEPKKLVPIVLNFDCDDEEPQPKSPEKTDETSPENNPKLTENNPEEQAILFPSNSEETPDIAESFKDTMVWINQDSSYRYFKCTSCCRVKK